MGERASCPEKEPPPSEEADRQHSYISLQPATTMSGVWLVQGLEEMGLAEGCWSGSTPSQLDSTFSP